MSPSQRSIRRSVVCEAAPTKKPDSAEKRARQAEKRRIYHKSRKSEIKTRMKKVLLLSFFYYGLHYLGSKFVIISLLNEDVKILV